MELHRNLQTPGIHLRSKFKKSKLKLNLILKILINLNTIFSLSLKWNNNFFFKFFFFLFDDFFIKNLIFFITKASQFVNIKREMKKFNKKSKISSFFNFQDDSNLSKEKIIYEIREYQKEIFENCKDKNSIIFLETGTGKTLISIMLIDYYLKRHSFSKKVFFL